MDTRERVADAVNSVIGETQDVWELRQVGSIAAPGYMKPEGVVVYHVAARMYFKKTIEKDEMPKGAKEDA